MRRRHDRILIRDLRDGGNEFIFVATSAGSVPMHSGDSTYNDVVAFPARDFRGDNEVTYPAVYEDGTVGIMREKTRPTTWDALPLPIRRRYEHWDATR